MHIEKIARKEKPNAMPTNMKRWIAGKFEISISLALFTCQRMLYGINVTQRNHHKKVQHFSRPERKENVTEHMPEQNPKSRRVQKWRYDTWVGVCVLVYNAALWPTRVIVVFVAYEAGAWAPPRPPLAAPPRPRLAKLPRPPWLPCLSKPPRPRLFNPPRLPLNPAP